MVFSLGRNGLAIVLLVLATLTLQAQDASVKSLYSCEQEDSLLLTQCLWTAAKAKTMRSEINQQKSILEILSKQKAEEVSAIELRSIDRLEGITRGRVNLLEADVAFITDTYHSWKSKIQTKNNLAGLDYFDSSAYAAVVLELLEKSDRTAVSNLDELEISWLSTNKYSVDKVKGTITKAQ